MIERGKIELIHDLKLATHPNNKCAMLFRPSMLEPEFNGDFPDKTELIVSVWRGYTDNPQFKAVESAIERCHGKIHYVHASGHIHSKDLITLIRDLNPQVLLPVHTETPEAFLEHFPQTQLIQDSQKINLNDQTLPLRH